MKNLGKSMRNDSDLTDRKGLPFRTTDYQQN